jgi:hypothetical protein
MIPASSSDTGESEWAADEALLNIVNKKERKKSPPFIAGCFFSSSCFVSITLSSSLSQAGFVQEQQGPLSNRAAAVGAVAGGGGGGGR